MYLGRLGPEGCDPPCPLWVKSGHVKRHVRFTPEGGHVQW
jgi:hypothetical protein